MPYTLRAPSQRRSYEADDPEDELGSFTSGAGLSEASNIDESEGNESESEADELYDPVSHGSLDDSSRGGAPSDGEEMEEDAAGEDDAPLDLSVKRRSKLAHSSKRSRLVEGSCIVVNEVCFEAPDGMCPRPVTYSKAPFSKRHVVLDHPSELLELECAADLIKRETQKGPNMDRALI
jgi:hypothetical protein